MIYKLSKHIILFFILVLIVFLSCKRNCDYLPVSVAGVRFYTISNNRPVAKSIDSMYVYALNIEDSVLYNWVKNVSSIRLPFSPFEDYSGFVIKLNGNTDTLHFHYKRQLYFVSEECGFSMNFSIDSLIYSGSTIDSIVIIQPKVQVINEEHIRFYF